MPGRRAIDLDRVSVPHVLREYALLADGERGILVGPRGDFAWMCFPRWDSEARFATLIGGRGVYTATPRGRHVWGGYYELGLIWRSRWVTTGGTIECREALALPSHPGRAVILRQIIAAEGPATVDVTLDLCAAFGKTPARALRRDDDGVWHARLGDARVTWVGGSTAQPHPDGHRGTALTMDLELDAGASHDLVLVLDRDGDAPPPDPGLAWSGTEAGWRERIPPLDGTAARRDARHSYAVLHGLASSGGGMVAAATTSLPERARQGRSFDYRYAWIRDQAMTGQAVAAAGPYPLLDQAVGFVAARVLEDGPQLVPAYTVDGGAVPSEHRLGLTGYPGGATCWATGSTSSSSSTRSARPYFCSPPPLDTIGSTPMAGGPSTRLSLRSPSAGRNPTPVSGKSTRPDGRTGRLICVAGLRSISAHQRAERAVRWLELADVIAAEAATGGVHPSGRWQRSPTDDRVDAALLLAAIRGGLPPDDLRSLATLHAVERELTEDGYCYRYRPDQRPLGEAEGAFLLCGFLLSLAWAQQGDGTRAARWFERNRAACGPPGLMAEEYDVRQRQLRGNLPQAFVHALLLECAVTEAAAGEELQPGG